MTTQCYLIALLLAAPTVAAAQAPDGKALYEANCKMCHGPAGIPPAPMKKAMPGIPVFDSAFISTRSADSVVSVLMRGGKTMKAFKEKLSHEQMVAVARYVRELALKGHPARSP